jgi:hypothetical protein
MPLPTNSLDLAVLLHKQLQQQTVHEREITGLLPASLDFGEVQSALDDADLLVVADETQQKIEFALPPNFFWPISELISTGERRTVAPIRFYLADLDFLYTVAATDTPVLIKNYLDAIQLYDLLGGAADFKAGIGSTKTLVFLQKEKLEIVPDYTVTDLVSLPRIVDLKSQFLESETHKEQKRTILRTVLFEMYESRTNVRLSDLLARFGEFMDKLGGSYQLYVSEFSFHKVKAEIEKEKLDATTKLNKVFADIQNQLLAVPAALILVGGQMENTNTWAGKNIVIWLGGLVFSVLMTLLIRNQRHTLFAVKQEIDQQWQQIKGKYSSVADRFEPSYKQLDQRYHHQKWLLRVVSFLVAVSLAVATGMLLWFSVPASLILPSLLCGFVAATPLVIWDVFHWARAKFFPTRQS